MSAEALLDNQKASQVFFVLAQKRAGLSQIAKTCKLKKTEAGKILDRMFKSGILTKKRNSFDIDWERFVPIFLRKAMNVYAAAMPWKFIPRFVEQGEENFIEAACAKAERELARVKVKLGANDLFQDLIRSYFEILATEAWAPDDYLEDLRVADAIDEFEYALLKLLPAIRRKKRDSKQAKDLFRLLNDWYKQVVGYDTPSGSALRAAFQQQELL